MKTVSNFLASKHVESWAKFELCGDKPQLKKRLIMIMMNKGNGSPKFKLVE